VVLERATHQPLLISNKGTGNRVALVAIDRFPFKTKAKWGISINQYAPRGIKPISLIKRLSHDLSPVGLLMYYCPGHDLP
jgi:hypothetical protein